MDNQRLILLLVYIFLSYRQEIGASFSSARERLKQLHAKHHPRG